MLEAIYILENESTENAEGYTPNFVIPNTQSYQSESKGDLYSTITSAKTASLLKVAMPFPYLFISSVKSLLSDDKSEPTPELEEEKAILLEQIKRMSLSSNAAKDLGYKFQPGHPLIGRVYRRHPLADYEQANKKDLYIPSDCYDQLLLEEREAEMIKLLVDLGAKKITITSTEDNNADSTRKYSAKVGVENIGGGGVSYSDATSSANSFLNTREFVLSGKKWLTDSELERQKFFWLDYEPSWNAVVHARENGGCIQASLELKESTSFSVDKNLEFEVKAKMVQGGGGFGVNDLNKQSKKYYVYVEFNPVE